MADPDVEVNLDNLDIDFSKIGEAPEAQAQSGNADEGQAAGAGEAKPEGETKPVVEGEGTPAEEQGKTEGQQQQAEEDPIIKTVGKDTFLRVKGKDYPLSELTPDQVRAYLQKGLAFEKNQSELAAQRKAFQEELERERAKLAQGLQALQAIQGPKGKTEPQGEVEQEIPDLLKPGQYDTPEMTQLKSMNADLTKRLAALEKVEAAKQYTEAEKNFLAEIDSHMEQFPLASKEEVVAVKLLYPNAPLDQLVQKSHEERANEKFVENIFKHKPDLYLKFSEKAVADYLRKKASSGAVPLSGGAGATPKTTQTKVDPDKIDFDLAESMIREKLKGLGAAQAEAES